jgi:hypothetical protein
MGILLKHISSPAWLHKLNLEKGDLSDKAFYLLVRRG